MPSFDMAAEAIFKFDTSRHQCLTLARDTQFRRLSVCIFSEEDIEKEIEINQLQL